MRLSGPAARQKQGTAPSGSAPRRQPGRGRSAAGDGEGHPDPAALLAWYDRHRRVLPWRARAGEKPDPYRVWLSEIMLQQTTVRAVAPYYARFLERFPTVRHLAAAPLEEVLKAWAGLGYYARARNLHACARTIVERHGGSFPDTEAVLLTLPGVGRYTAAAIAAIAFDRRASPVDGNVERVMARLYAVDQPLRQAKPAIRRLAEGLTPQRRTGDFAQALMDLGATVCTPKQPACILCPWMSACAARRQGEPDLFPVKTPKTEGRLRRGATFVALRIDGHILLRTRPAHGLLGGMTEVPTTAWAHDFVAATALDEAPPIASRERAIRWRRRVGVVTHTFTHFPLELVVYVATVPADAVAPEGTRWVALAGLDGEALPSLMRKVVAHALPVAPPGKVVG
jgi:A/G-specific adenine glycosylase